MGTDYNVKSVCSTIGKVSGKSEQIEFMCGILDMFADNPWLLLTWKKGNGHVIAMQWLLDNKCMEQVDEKYHDLLSGMVGIGLIEVLEEV
jgi:hypothetical protein